MQSSTPAPAPSQKVKARLLTDGSFWNLFAEVFDDGLRLARNDVDRERLANRKLGLNSMIWCIPGVI